MTRIAMCACGEPLVSTLAFRKFEFYCLSCGRTYGWLDPIPAPETPELLARTDAVRDEFDALSEGLIGDGAHLQACAQCRTEEHMAHATAAELLAHAQAFQRLRDRAARTADAH